MAEAPTGWTTETLSGDVHKDADKPARVRSMFAAIAHAYDLNNHLHSLWLDHAWRRFAVRKAGLKPTDDVLDCACGTGDLTLALARATPRSVTGLDFTPEMLDIARRKTAARAPAAANFPALTYIQGDAQALPFADASFDVVTIAFGIRNVMDPGAAVREFRRVLRPGGRLVILEFAEPRLAPVRWFNDLYCRRIMPRTATLISRDRSGAYRYLPKSVAKFMSAGELRKLLRDTTFESVEDWSLSLGICRCYRARVPSQPLAAAV